MKSLSDRRLPIVLVRMFFSVCKRLRVSLQYIIAQVNRL